jgi:hypothetical protein
VTAEKRGLILQIYFFHNLSGSNIAEMRRLRDTLLGGVGVVTGRALEERRGTD